MYIVLTVPLLILLLCPSGVCAEGYFDIYFGQARSAAENVTVNYQPFMGAPETATRRVDFGSSTELGIRGVMWNDLNPGQGFSLELGTFDASGDGADINVIYLSILYMARARLQVSEKYEAGRFQPYFGIGLFMPYASGRFNFSPEISNSFSASGGGFGPVLKLGLRWLISEDSSFFAEFGHTRASLDMESSLWSNTAKTDLETTHLLIGFSMGK